VDIIKLLTVIVVSIVIGSILTGDIVARLKRINLRSQGSGNVGATNAFRSMGSFYGAVVLAGDTLKGVVAVLIGRYLGEAFGIDLAAVSGLMVIIGHNWSIFAGFKGGKGIATSLGVIIALTPMSLVIVLPAWLIFFFSSGFVSLASIVAAVAYPISVFIFYSGSYYKCGLALLLGIIAIYRHRENIRRLMQGCENRILYKDKRSAKKE